MRRMSALLSLIFVLAASALAEVKSIDIKIFGMD